MNDKPETEPVVKKSPRVVWVGVGLAFGAGMGVLMNNIAIGAGRGLVIGAVMDLIQNRNSA